MNFHNIGSPPPNSAITVEHHPDGVQFSGASRSASQEALREKFATITSPPKSVADRLASLPWQLTIRANQIEFTQERLLSVDDDECIFRPQDVQRFSVSPEGYVIAHLSGTAGEETTMTLSGLLEETDANWLRDTLAELLEGAESKRQTVSNFGSRAFTSLNEQQLPRNCRLMSSSSSGELVIHYLASVGLGEKITMTVIYLIFGAVFGGIPLYFALTYFDEIRPFPLLHWAALLGVVLSIVFGIHAQGKAMAQRARRRHAEPRDQRKPARRRFLPSILFVIVPLAILFYAYRNLEQVKEFPVHVWLIALGLILGIGLVGYFVWQILWNLGGRTLFIASDQFLQIQKKLVFPLSSRMIFSMDLKCFELTELIHVRDGREHRYWGLEAILPNQAVRLLPKEIEFDTADWLGRTLAKWFDVPFIKAHEKEAMQSRYHEELG